MKNLITLILGLLLISCSKEEPENDNQITPTKLSSITTNYYYNNVFQSSSKLNFQNDKIIDCRVSNGGYSDYQYENNLVSRIREFKADGSVLRTYLYKYDNDDRIIEAKTIKSATNTHTEEVTKFTFEYNANQILINGIYPSGDITSTKLYLDQNNNIISEENNNISTPITYTFNDGNLTNAIDNSTGSSISNTYLSNTFKNEINYNKYLFGKHWKKNYCLTLFAKGYSLFSYLETTSINLISKSVLTENNSTLTNTYNYTFNDKNQITKQYIVNTEFFNINNSTESSSTELLYEYK